MAEEVNGIIVIGPSAMRGRGGKTSVGGGVKWTLLGANVLVPPISVTKTGNKKNEPKHLLHG